MILALETFWRHFTLRMKTVNAQRQCLGFMDAQQWPPKPVVSDAFYLLVLGSSPVEGESIAVPIYVHTVQFTWMNRGTDINNASNVVGLNRGDRFQTCMAMREECVKACWPYFAQKQQLSVDAAQNLQAVQNGNEPVKWTKPQFTLHADKASGLLYSTGTCRITDMTDVINDQAPSDSAYANVPCP